LYKFVNVILAVATAARRKCKC